MPVVDYLNVELERQLVRSWSTDGNDDDQPDYGDDLWVASEAAQPAAAAFPGHDHVDVSASSGSPDGQGGNGREWLDISSMTAPIFRATDPVDDFML